MATLPILKSGASAQYPFRRSVRQDVAAVTFLDGTEQRCATSRALHEWTIQLGPIDEQELGAIQTFFEQQQGEAGHFSFTDPADGVLYADCSFAIGTLDQTYASHARVMVTLTIRENPL